MMSIRDYDQTAAKHALLFGATGLVGEQLLKLLLSSPAYEQVTAFVRRSGVLPSHPKLTEVIADFDQLEQYASAYPSGGDVYCCLGTTIKNAKTREAFRRVDYDYPLRIGQLALAAGVRRLLIVSAAGADAEASVFYSRVKGELERDLQALGLPALHVFRPSLLLGERREVRFGERAAAAIAQTLPFVFSGPLRRYKPVHARSVAAAMLAAAQLGGDSGVVVHDNEAIHSA